MGNSNSRQRSASASTPPRQLYVSHRNLATANGIPQSQSYHQHQQSQQYASNAAIYSATSPGVRVKRVQSEPMQQPKNYDFAYPHNRVLPSSPSPVQLRHVEDGPGTLQKHASVNHLSANPHTTHLNGGIDATAGGPQTSLYQTENNVFSFDVNDQQTSQQPQYQMANGGNSVANGGIQVLSRHPANIYGSTQVLPVSVKPQYRKSKVERAPSVISRTSSRRSIRRNKEPQALPAVGKVKEFYIKHGFPVNRLEAGRVTKPQMVRVRKTVPLSVVPLSHSTTPLVVSRATSLMDVRAAAGAPGVGVAAAGATDSSKQVLYRPVFRRRMEPVGFVAQPGSAGLAGPSGAISTADGIYQPQYVLQQQTQPQAYQVFNKPILEEGPSTSAAPVAAHGQPQAQHLVSNGPSSGIALPASSLLLQQQPTTSSSAAAPVYHHPNTTQVAQVQPVLQNQVGLSSNYQAGSQLLQTEPQLLQAQHQQQHPQSRGQQLNFHNQAHAVSNQALTSQNLQPHHQIRQSQAAALRSHSQAEALHNQSPPRQTQAALQNQLLQQASALSHSHQVLPNSQFSQYPNAAAVPPTARVPSPPPPPPPQAEVQPRLKNIYRNTNKLSSPQPLYQSQPDTFRKFKNELTEEFRRRANRRPIMEKKLKKTDQIVTNNPPTGGPGGDHSIAGGRRNSTSTTQDYDYRIAKEFAFLNREADYSGDHWEFHSHASLGSLDADTQPRSFETTDMGRSGATSPRPMSNGSIDSDIKVLSRKIKSEFDLRDRVIAEQNQNVNHRQKNSQPVRPFRRKSPQQRNIMENKYYVVRTRHDLHHLELVGEEDYRQLQREDLLLESEAAPKILVDMARGNKKWNLSQLRATNSNGASIHNINEVRMDSKLLDDFVTQESGGGGPGVVGNGVSDKFINTSESSPKERASYTILEKADYHQQQHSVTNAYNERRSGDKRGQRSGLRKERESEGLKKLRDDLRGSQLNTTTEIGAISVTVSGKQTQQHQQQQQRQIPLRAGASVAANGHLPSSKKYGFNNSPPEKQQLHVHSSVNEIRRYDEGVLVRVGYDNSSVGGGGGGGKDWSQMNGNVKTGGGAAAGKGKGAASINISGQYPHTDYKSTRY